MGSKGISVETWAIGFALLGVQAAAMIAMFRGRHGANRGWKNLLWVLVFPVALYRGLATLFRTRWIALPVTFFCFMYAKGLVVGANFMLMKNSGQDVMIAYQLKAMGWSVLFLIPAWEAVLIAWSRMGQKRTWA